MHNFSGTSKLTRNDCAAPPLDTRNPQSRPDFEPQEMHSSYFSCSINTRPHFHGIFPTSLDRPTPLDRKKEREKERGRKKIGLSDSGRERVSSDHLSVRLAGGVDRRVRRRPKGEIYSAARGNFSTPTKIHTNIPTPLTTVSQHQN